VPGAWRLAALPAVIGLLVSLLGFPLRNDEQLEAMYVLFCLFVAAYTVRGMLRGHLDTANIASKQQLSRLGPSDVALAAVAAVIGGCLTGYIGVCIEKVLFVLLTWRYGVNARAASVTSIALVGWISAVAFALHAIAPCSPAAPGYIGAVPYAYWLMVLPGILVGSVVGPYINAAVGSRRVMIAFVVLLLVEVGRYSLLLLAPSQHTGSGGAHSTSWHSWTDPGSWHPLPQGHTRSCRPQTCSV